MTPKWSDPDGVGEPAGLDEFAPETPAAEVDGPGLDDIRQATQRDARNGEARHAGQTRADWRYDYMVDPAARAERPAAQAVPVGRRRRHPDARAGSRRWVDIAAFVGMATAGAMTSFLILVTLMNRARPVDDGAADAAPSIEAAPPVQPAETSEAAGPDPLQPLADPPLVPVPDVPDVASVRISSSPSAPVRPPASPAAEPRPAPAPAPRASVETVVVAERGGGREATIDAPSGVGAAGAGDLPASAPVQPPRRSASTPEAPIREPPAAPPPPASPPAAVAVAPAATVPTAPAVDLDERAIREVLEGYRHAVSELDLAATRRMWPTVDERALARAFAGVETQQVAFDDCRIATGASEAQAVCGGTVRYVPGVGSRTTQLVRRQWTFTLRQDAGQWRIQRIDTR